MAEKLGLFSQLVFGDWSERATINRNAEELSAVGANVDELRRVARRQADEILKLRAMFMGIVDVLEQKAGVQRTDLEDAVDAAWAKLNPAPPPDVQTPQAGTTGDPYRGTVGEASAAEIDAAKALLATAQEHHFSRRFLEARAVYQQIVEQYGNTKHANTARDQLKNLRNA